MDYYVERLETELKNILDFWMENLVSENYDGIYHECSADGTVNPQANISSLFLGRVIYGASAACRFLNTTDYKALADKAFKQLYENLKNPVGGFYWSKTPDGQIVHNSKHINMAQAFVLYGLAEYTMLTDNPIVKSELDKQKSFIINTLQDKHNGGFIDGFSVDWKHEQTLTKSLGTNFHILESLVKYFEYSKDNTVISLIQDLVGIIMDKFILKESYNCVEALTSNWEIIPGKSFAGLNAKVIWGLTEISERLEDEILLEKCSKLSQNMMNNLIEFAFDKEHGGVFNEISENTPTEKRKFWWIQAEATIALMKTYYYTQEKTYLNYAIRLIEYIDNTFSDNTIGEWHPEISAENGPNLGTPKIYLWKSIYHNVRYCIETSNTLKMVISKPEPYTY